MTNQEKITIEIPVYIAQGIAEWKDCYAPLLREVANACYNSLYDNKIISE